MSMSFFIRASRRAGNAIVILLVAGATALTFTAPGARAAVSFEGLGFVNATTAEALSGDGNVVIGRYAGSKGYRYNRTTGQFLDLGSLRSDYYENYPRAANYDGSVIVGRSPSQAYIWTKDRLTGLPFLASYPFAEANDVSHDGRVVAGWQALSSSNSWNSWRHEDGGFTTLPPPAGTTSANLQAQAISGDGSTIVGIGIVAAPIRYAFRWTADGGTVDIGDIPGGSTYSEAYGVNYDGSVVVGWGIAANSQNHAFRWTAETGAVDIHGGMDPLRQSNARDVSDDGNVIVGSSSMGAFVWTPQSGMRLLKDVLQENGVDMTGWTLRWANGVSADGTTIVGDATSPAGKGQAFIAIIPEPAALAPISLAALLLRRRVRCWTTLRR